MQIDEGHNIAIKSNSDKKTNIKDISSLFSFGEKLDGGLSDGIPDSKFDKKQLESGIKIEMEHTDDKEKAKEIAKDHLVEDPDYYVKLLKYIEK